MNRQNWRAFGLLVLGVALLANPLYLYPESVSYETELTYEAEETARIPKQAETWTDIKWCYGATSTRECGVAAALTDGDSLRVPLDHDRTLDEPLPNDYDYVRIDGQYYEPVESIENSTLVIELEPVADETVRNAAAEEYADARSFARSAIENGSATVIEDEVYDSGTLFIERGGTYYKVSPVESERRPTGWGWKEPSRLHLDAMRLTAWIGGIACLWRAGEWTERGRQAAESTQRRRS
ncbi:hypothetical protein [Haloferax sp. DFSO60]|uniref:hypothetical protein n=1 Tax=Haloferax sp. DFSO60 TaxID=3388652 RepID=UPI00397E21DD